MLIGCCVNMLPKDADDPGAWYAPEIKSAGYDYIELPIGQIVGLSASRFDELHAYLSDVGLPVYACNNFFASDIKLVGENVDKPRVRDFYCAVLERASILGARYTVLGSPWSKACPQGFSPAAAFDQLTEWCIEIGDESGRYGITVALEPNNRHETNMINTFADTVLLARAANCSKVRCLQDYYHMRVENDTVDSLLADGKKYLVHSHFARIDGRGFPASQAEDVYYKTYFDALRAIGYDGGVSMEGFPRSCESFPEEAAATCRFLKSIANA